MISVWNKKNNQLNLENYEKGNLEDRYSGHRINPDCGSDRYGNHVVHGSAGALLEKGEKWEGDGRKGFAPALFLCRFTKRGDCASLNQEASGPK